MSDFNSLDQEPFYDCPTEDTMREFFQRVKIYLPKDKKGDKRIVVLVDRIHKENKDLNKQAAWITLSIHEAYLVQKYLNDAILVMGGI
jgi:hypothetical protein